MAKSVEKISKRPIRLTLRTMRVGDEVRFPLSRYSTVKVTASCLGIELDRVYTTSVSRDDKSVCVLRKR